MFGKPAGGLRLLTQLSSWVFGKPSSHLSICVITHSLMRNNISGMTRNPRWQQQGFLCLVKIGLMWRLSQTKGDIWTINSKPELFHLWLALSWFCFSTKIHTFNHRCGGRDMSRASHCSRSGQDRCVVSRGYSSRDSAMSISARWCQWERGRVGLTKVSETLSAIKQSVEGQPWAFWLPWLIYRLQRWGKTSLGRWYQPYLQTWSHPSALVCYQSISHSPVFLKHLCNPTLSHALQLF